VNCVTGEDCIVRNFMVRMAYYLPDVIRVNQGEKNEMGGACSRYWGTGEVQKGVWWGNLKERGYLEDLSINATVILNWILILYIFHAI
jgi:hypothetical protein